MCGRHITLSAHIYLEFQSQKAFVGGPQLKLSSETCSIDQPWV